MDSVAFGYYVTPEDEPPVTLYTSAVGNPYFFTGRRMHFMETLHDGTPGDKETNQRVQYNRARHYSPTHGVHTRVLVVVTVQCALRVQKILPQKLRLRMLPLSP